MFADIYKIYAVAFVAALSFNVLSPILPEVSRAFQLERMEGLVQFGGLNNLLLFLPMGILSLLYAIVGNRIRIPLSLVALVLSLVLFWIYISQSTLSFTLGYLFLGSTLGLLIPGLYAVARGLPNAPPFATSININIMIGIGLAVGQYASALIAQSFSWRLVYLVLACISILICPVLALSMPSQNLIAERFNINKIPRRAWLLLAQYLPGSVPWGGFSVFIFSYMETDCGISKASAVFLVTILGVGMVSERSCL
ncbi:MAG: MFS transporter [Spirochaetia bacterium]|nr:MFS transporter [Spirochaetia bacterium]